MTCWYGLPVCYMLWTASSCLRHVDHAAFDFNQWRNYIICARRQDMHGTHKACHLYWFFKQFLSAISHYDRNYRFFSCGLAKWNQYTNQSFLVSAIISGTGKATDFKFGRYVHRVHPNKSPFKILEKRERGHIQWLPIVFKYPYYLRNG